MSPHAVQMRVAIERAVGHCMLFIIAQGYHFQATKDGKHYAMTLPFDMDGSDEKKVVKEFEEAFNGKPKRAEKAKKASKAKKTKAKSEDTDTAPEPARDSEPTEADS